MTGRIVIVGGGFAGVHAAMYFDKALAHRSDIDVVLISRENFILFTPMLHEVAAGDRYPGDIITPLRRILRRVNVVEGEVQSIDLSARRISCVAGRSDMTSRENFILFTGPERMAQHGEHRHVRYGLPDAGVYRVHGLGRGDRG
jgi:NADH:ubiquinone reductase (H+-translocating)